MNNFENKKIPEKTEEENRKGKKEFVIETKGLHRSEIYGKILEVYNKTIGPGIQKDISSNAINPEDFFIFDVTLLLKESKVDNYGEETLVSLEKTIKIEGKISNFPEIFERKIIEGFEDLDNDKFYDFLKIHQDFEVFEKNKKVPENMKALHFKDLDF